MRHLPFNYVESKFRRCTTLSLSLSLLKLLSWHYQIEKDVRACFEIAILIPPYEITFQIGYCYMSIVNRDLLILYY